MFNFLCLIVEILRTCNLRTGSPTKFADLQFADQSKEICRLLYLRKFTDLRLRIETRICRFKKIVVRPPLQICHQCQRYRWQIATIISATSSKPEVKNLVALSLWTFFCMYKIVQSENRRFTLSFLANWKLYPIAKSTVHKCPPLPPPHTHKWHKYIIIVRGGGFTCNTAELFSFGPSPTRAKKAWSSSTCLLYGV